MSHHSDLIDTTEMYLRTVYELEEEGIVPLRARIAERLGQSGPTVSQTVARMERDGLLNVAGNRHLELTEDGRREAVGVMRKHRLAERLLIDVIGLDWEDVHVEACRWEHVMSEAVERRIVTMLQPPFVCPHGNPIPGLDELGLSSAPDDSFGLTTLAAAARGVLAAGSDQAAESAESSLSGSFATAGSAVHVERISEQLQADASVMRYLTQSGLRPGSLITVRSSGPRVEIEHDGERVELGDEVSDHIFVRAV